MIDNKLLLDLYKKMAVDIYLSIHSAETIEQIKESYEFITLETQLKELGALPQNIDNKRQ